MNRSIILVIDERTRQQQLKAEGRFRHTLDDNELSESLKLAAIQEEVGEVARNVLRRAGMVTDGDIGDYALVKELTQIAALSVAWIDGILERKR